MDIIVRIELARSEMKRLSAEIPTTDKHRQCIRSGYVYWQTVLDNAVCELNDEYEAGR